MFNGTATAEIYTLSLHDALPILRETNRNGDYDWFAVVPVTGVPPKVTAASPPNNRSEEHTSELQSHHDLVCRLLLEKKKQQLKTQATHYKPSTRCFTKRSS